MGLLIDGGVADTENACAGGTCREDIVAGVEAKLHACPIEVDSHTVCMVTAEGEVVAEGEEGAGSVVPGGSSELSE